MTFTAVIQKDKKDINLRCYKYQNMIKANRKKTGMDINKEVEDE